MSPKPRFTIGKLAQRAEVGVETIRFYERKGLIRQPSKGDSSFREYSPVEVSRIQFIKRAQEIGFTLGEVQEILELEQQSRVRCADLKKRVDVKLEEVSAKIQDLLRVKKSLTKLSKACDAGAASVKECKVSDCFQNECC